MTHDDFRPRREKKNATKIRKSRRGQACVSKHAYERAIQRYGQAIDNDTQIIAQVRSGRAVRVCALHGGTALYIVSLGPKAALTVIDEKFHTVVTFLRPGSRDFELVESLAKIIMDMRGQIADAKRR